MATIYDVAKAAGVSPKTVSRVMNADGPVKARTRELVDAAMSQLGYVPSSAARAMRSNRTGLVGLVTGAISGPPAGGEQTGLPDLQIVRGIQQILSDHGMTLLISDTGGRLDLASRLMRTLREHRVEGIFYVAPHHQRIALPEESGSPLVLVNAFDDAGTPCVLPDDADGQQRLVAALIAEGHRRIGYLTLPQSLVADVMRRKGYRRALEAAGISYDPRLVIQGDYSGQPIERERLAEAMDLLLALDQPPTVLCCSNDRLAVAVCGMLRSRGVRVPEAMSVAGYDDYRVISETLFPGLTTMELPYEKMGEAAARLMLGELRGNKPLVSGTSILVQGDLRWRDSVTPGAARSQARSISAAQKGS